MTPDFELFWDEFPRKRRCNKPGTMKAFEKALREATFEEIMTGLAGYKQSDDVLNGFACMPTTFLNQQRWECDYSPVEKRPDKSVMKAKYFDLRERYKKPYHDFMSDLDVQWMLDYEKETTR